MIDKIIAEIDKPQSPKEQQLNIRRLSKAVEPIPEEIHAATIALSMKEISIEDDDDSVIEEKSVPQSSKVEQKVESLEKQLTFALQMIEALQKRVHQLENK
jgi:hypothetical protein